MTAPTGRLGQALALGILLLAGLAVWVGAVGPLLDWYEARSATLAGQTLIAARMAQLVATEPVLRTEVARLDAATPASASVLAGGSDAVAGASLQQAVGDIGRRAGVTVASAEMLPPARVGDYRRIGLHITLAGAWPQVVDLLDALSRAQPRMLVDDLSLRQVLVLGKGDVHPIDGALTVSAFRPGGAASP